MSTDQYCDRTKIEDNSTAFLKNDSYGKNNNFSKDSDYSDSNIKVELFSELVKVFTDLESKVSVHLCSHLTACRFNTFIVLEALFA